MKSKERNLALDVIRTIATLSIVIFHFFIFEKQIYNSNIVFPNYDLGSFGVSLFLILSGAALVISEKEKFSIKEFYKKRAKSIYPLFICGTLLFFIINFLINPHAFDMIKTKNWIVTLLGFGGFLSYRYPTFNQVGEWYIGCILILYLIYPMIRYLSNKKPVLTFLTIFAIYLLYNIYYNSPIPAIWNPLLRMMEFTFGIYYAKYCIVGKYKPKGKVQAFLTGTSLILFIITVTVPNNLYIMIKILLGGIFSFIFLMQVGEYLKSRTLKKIIGVISKYSYAIFIVHHQVNWLLASRFNSEVLMEHYIYYIFIIYLVLVGITAVSLNVVTNKIMQFIKE